MLASAARVVVPLVLFAVFLLVAWAFEARAERRESRPLDPPADDAGAPDHEPPRELPAAA